MGIDSTLITSCLRRVKSVFTSSSSTTTDMAAPTAEQAGSHQDKPGPVPQDPVLPDYPVFVDIPDVDNVLCCLSVIRRNPERRINIVLTPRPVDFAVKPYGTNRDRIMRELWRITDEPDDGLRNRLAVRRIMTPFGSPPDWVKDLEDPIAREYFLRPDKLFRDDDANKIKSDTRLYMQVSAYRFASFLRGRGIHHSRYRFFWSEDSMGRVAPGMRHATHVPDYTYGFDDKLLAEHNAALEIQDDDQRANELRTLCTTYVEAEKGKWAAVGVKTSILGTLNDLMEEQSMVLPDDAEVKITIGGGFTEVVTYLRNKKLWNEKVRRRAWITAMAGYIKGEGNILANQFNISIDLSSAWEFFALVQEMQIPTLLVPTELVKDPAWRLTEAQLKDVFEGHPAVLEAFSNFTSQAKALESITLFDWVTAIVPYILHLLETRKVVPIIATESWTTSEPFATDVPVKDEEGKIIRMETKMKVRTTMVPVEVNPQPETIPPSTDAPSVMLRFKEASPGQESYVRMCWTTNKELIRPFQEGEIKLMKEDLDSSRDTVLNMVAVN
ncbi:hypothetical protein Micbo1qcDRAFT_169437 [Microdochium bolleyi]|uniref:Uncharacterized protein n=1 Tax=Microdochium bolleyi TaxID=196109 RepID=A0A136IKE5_9PEZI|nr:hypothetical protein Micbo1qcDRAFT_169437 [Microdochium bolleyi]